MTNLGKWNRWYASLDEPTPYGSTETYRIGADFLVDCDTVEDWGCGKGFMRTMIDPNRYRGLDGSHSKFADDIVDLATYRPARQPDGIFMRHVLEHDYRWDQILQNAVAAARRKLVLVTFTPEVDETHELYFADDPGVPTIAFNPDDLTRHLTPKFDYTVEHLATITEFGVETVYLCEVES